MHVVWQERACGRPSWARSPVARGAACRWSRRYCRSRRPVNPPRRPSSWRSRPASPRRGASRSTPGATGGVWRPPPCTPASSPPPRGCVSPRCAPPPRRRPERQTACQAARRPLSRQQSQIRQIDTGSERSAGGLPSHQVALPNISAAYQAHYQKYQRTGRKSVLGNLNNLEVWNLTTYSVILCACI